MRTIMTPSNIKNNETIVKWEEIDPNICGKV